MNTNPAKRIVRILGGARAVSQIAGVDISRVYRWQDRPGPDGRIGVIPDDHHDVLMDAARQRGVVILRDHFYDPPEQKGAA